MRDTKGNYLGDSAFAVYARGAATCVARLATERADLDGYSINQTINDNEAARKAMGYAQINPFGNSYGKRVQMLYQWRYPNSIQRNVMVAVNPPGHFLFDPLSLEALLGQYAELYSLDAFCSARTLNLLVTLRALPNNMPSSWMGFDVETLLVSGTLDGSTPLQYARDERMPHLSNGHHVIIKDQAHTETFWHSQSKLARARPPTQHFFRYRGSG